MSDETVFDGHADVPPLTGSRHWYDLSGPEQDEYLLACFKGDRVREQTERKLDLYDRIAISIAHFLLDDHFGLEPKSPEQALAVQIRRTLALQNTLLGERLVKALGRREVIDADRVSPGAFDYSQDPMLFFEPLDFAGTRGFETLSFECVKKFEISKKEADDDWRKLSAEQRRQVTERIERSFDDLTRTSTVAPANARAPRNARTVSTSPEHLIWIPQVVAIAVLLWALYPGNPYGYYVFVRWMVGIVLAYVAYNAFIRSRDLFAWLCVVGAVAYNPVIPVELTRDIWNVINVATIMLLSASVWMLQRTSRRINRLRSSRGGRVQGAEAAEGAKPSGAPGRGRARR